MVLIVTIGLEMVSNEKENCSHKYKVLALEFNNFIIKRRAMLIDTPYSAGPELKSRLKTG